jgi:hypothetical protein
MNRLLILLSIAVILLVGCKDVRNVSIIDPYNSAGSGLLAKTTSTPLIDNNNLTYSQSFSVNGVSDESMKFSAVFAQGSGFDAELKMKKGITPGNYTITFDAKNLMLDISAEDGSPAFFSIPPILSLTYNQVSVNRNEINVNDPQFYSSGSFIVPGGVSLDHSNTVIKVNEAQINVGNYGFRPMDAKHFLKHVVIDGSNGTNLTYKYIYPDGTIMKATLNALKGSFVGIHNFDLDFSIENLSLNISSAEVTSEFAIPLELTLVFENPNNSYKDLINKYDPQFYRITGAYENYVVIDNNVVSFNDYNNKIKVNKAQLKQCALYGFHVDKLDYLYQYTPELTVLNSKGGNITFKYTYPDGAVLSASLKIAKGSFTSMGKESVTFWIDFDRTNSIIEFSPSGSNFDIPIELDLTYDLSKSTNPSSPLFNLNSSDITFTCLDDGTPIPYKKINIDPKGKRIEVQAAQIPHFSRYGWTNRF